MSESPDLVAKLQASDPEVQAYVAALKAQLAKSQKRVVNLEAENVALDFRIRALQQQAKKSGLQVDVNRSLEDPSPSGPELGGNPD